MAPATRGIAYLNGPRLRRSLIAAAGWVDACREELNRINVFPVPDGDTGTNFAMTLNAVAESVRPLDGADLPTVTKAMAEACVFSARGNSGMLLSHFLIGFRDTLGNRAEASAEEVARALHGGAEQLHAALDQPVEGTILTVSRDVAHAAQGASERTHNLVDFWRRILKEGNESLRRTPELLASLKEAGVVDAGGQGFIRLLEGVMRLIDGDPIVAPSQRFDSPSAASLADVETDKDFQYCTEVLVRGADLPASNDVRHVLRKLGGSIVVLAAGDLLKVHVHTDTPETVFELAHTWGKVESTKADDMREQHEELHTDAREVAIVVDSSCDLPDSLLDDHDIILVPLQVIRDGQAFQDRLDPETRNIYEQMRAGAVFTTSQPTPGAFSRTYRDALGQANKVFSPILASALSGTFNSAQTAANSVDSERITLFDSRTASLGLGLLALLAAEMAQQGRSPSQISAALEKARARSAGFFTVDVFDNLLRSGRVGRGKALLGSLLSIKPILEVGLDGAIAPADRARGRTAVIPKVLQILEQRLSPRPTELRMAIAHADDPESAERLEAELQQRFSPKQIVVGPVTPAIGVHVGPGAWAVFYQIEDDVFGD